MTSPDHHHLSKLIVLYFWLALLMLDLGYCLWESPVKPRSKVAIIIMLYISFLSLFFFFFLSFY